MTQRINYILFGLLALMWSGSFINIKVVVDALPPIFCSMIRVLVSLVFLSVIFLTMRKRSFTPTRHTWKIWLTGLFNQALPFALLFYGEKFVAPALASILNSTVSLWALLLGACLFRDMTNWTPIKMAGLLLGFTGIMIIFMPALHQGESNLIGIASIMAMAISYALGSIVNQHLIFAKLKTPFEANLIHQHIASFFALLIVSLSFEPWPTTHSLLNIHLWMAFLYLGLIATAIAWIIYFYLIREWGAVRTASVMYIVPVLAILWDLLFLHIVPTATELIGTIAILTGVVLVQWTRKTIPYTPQPAAFNPD